MIKFLINKDTLHIFTEGRCMLKSLESGESHIAIDMSKEEMENLVKSIEEKLQ